MKDLRILDIKNLIISYSTIFLLFSCSNGLNNDEVTELVRYYYNSHPFMLRHPEVGNMDIMEQAVGISGVTVVLSEVRVVEVGKKNQDGMTAINVSLKGTFNAGKKENVDKVETFYFGKNEFGRAKLNDQYGRYGVEYKK